MSSFSRSLKSPSYLSPRRRPALGRSMSGSSEISMASPVEDIVATIPGPTTPQAYQNRRYGPPSHLSGSESALVTRENPYFGAGSRPIAIELPRMNRFNTAPVYTPPEPLSARGDLPGGYFPMHEDPDARVHRPHPFHQGSVPRTQPVTDAETLQQGVTASHAATYTTNMAAHTNIPVASYCPTGFSDNSLQIGRYYPSNYENSRESHKSRPNAASASSVDPKSSTQSKSSSPSAPSDLDIRQKLWRQQYQRDMIARHAAKQSEISVSSSGEAKAVLSQMEDVTARRMPPGKALSFGPQSLHKPHAPRLHPLGSPGPVTPMDLESSGGNYLDKGKGRDRSSQVLVPPPPGKGFTANSM